MKKRNFISGQKFSAYIRGKYVEGKIFISPSGRIYLMQNSKDGGTPRGQVQFGFKYSWYIGDGCDESLKWSEVYDLKLFATDEWQKGDLVKYKPHEKSFKYEVAEVYGCMVFLKLLNKELSSIFIKTVIGTQKDFEVSGFIRIEEDKPKEETFTYSMQDIADKLGIDVKKLKIKK